MDRAERSSACSQYEELSYENRYSVGQGSSVKAGTEARRVHVSMACPTCGTRALVVSTKLQKDGRTVKRSRLCENGHRFFTLEYVRTFSKKPKEI